MLFALALGLPDTPAADTLQISIGREFVVEDGGGAPRQFPFLAYVDGKLFATYSQHRDGYVDHPVDGLRGSADGGLTWPLNVQAADFYLTSIVKLADGRLLGMSYITYRVDERHQTCHYWLSADSGQTWTKATGVVEVPQDMGKPHETWGGMLFHRSLLRLPDGSLQGTMYGKYASDTRYRVIWVKSTDQGSNWKVVSTVATSATSPGREGFCEPVAIRAADGTLLVVMRVESGLPLYQSRSTDHGLTWSTPTTLPGVDPADTHSVDPEMTLMTNGTLVLSYGRMATRMLFSLDGSGYAWGFLTDTFGTGSGYTGVREVAPNRLLVITENSTHQRVNNTYHNLNSSPPKILGKYLDVVRSTIPASAPISAASP
jgi:hypothetical protein